MDTSNMIISHCHKWLDSNIQDNNKVSKLIKKENNQRCSKEKMAWANININANNMEMKASVDEFVRELNKRKLMTEYGFKELQSKVLAHMQDRRKLLKKQKQISESLSVETVSEVSDSDATESFPENDVEIDLTKVPQSTQIEALMMMTKSRRF